MDRKSKHYMITDIMKGSISSLACLRFSAGPSAFLDRKVCGFTNLECECGCDISYLDVFDGPASVAAVIGHESSKSVVDLIASQRLLGDGYERLVGRGLGRRRSGRRGYKS